MNCSKGLIFDPSVHERHAMFSIGITIIKDILSFVRLLFSTVGLLEVLPPAVPVRTPKLGNVERG